MNWDAVQAIAESVGAVAVVASLVYLAGQVRHNSRSVEAATNHSLTQARNEMNIAIATNPALSGLIIRGGADYAALEPEERLRFNAYVSGIFNLAEDTYLQYTRGLASGDNWESIKLFLSGLLAAPGFRDWWISNRLTIGTPEFRAQLDALIPTVDQGEPAV